MAEWRNGGNGGTAERMAENSRMAEMATYILFMVHNEDDTDDVLIFYSIELAGISCYDVIRIRDGIVPLDSFLRSVC